MKKKALFILLYLIQPYIIYAHPMPNTLVEMKIHEKSIAGKLFLPLNELQSAIGLGVNDNPQNLVERLGDTLQSYVYSHLKPTTLDGKPWKVLLEKMNVNSVKSNLSGDYNELQIDFVMFPPQAYDLRNFYFNYDAILHRVASHRIIVSISQDWARGFVSEDSTVQEIGLIELDVPTNTIKPLQVSLEKGNRWNGFKSMVILGVHHIAEGIDHLLFLLVLLLPAVQWAINKKWAGHKSAKESFWSILKIVTAFTIGHSLTLLLGALGILQFPQKPIELLITFTIFISAIHAIKPLFPKKEMLIAGGFGLIHGLAFAFTLANLKLSTGNFLLSVLGFNLGVEIFQLVLIVLLLPILILLSRNEKIYPIVRVGGAILAIIASIYWFLQRL